MPVLTPVCAVGKPGDDYSALIPGGAAPAAAPESPKAEAAAAPVAAAVPAATVSADGLKASPRAKNLAKTQNLDLRLATATGPYGRIIERDVRDMMAKGIGATGAAFARSGCRRGRSLSRHWNWRTGIGKGSDRCSRTSRSCSRSGCS